MKNSTIVFVLALLAVKAEAQRGQMDSVSYYYNAIKSEPDPLKMEPLVVNMEKYSLQNQGLNNAFLLDYSRGMVADAFAEKGDMVKVSYWISRISDGAAADGVVLSAVSRLIALNKLADAEQLMMPVWEKLKSDGGGGKTAAGPMGGQGPSAADFAYQYGVILYKKGEYKKAIGYLSPAEGNSGRGRRGGGEIYAMALANAGETDKAFDQMRKLVATTSHHSEEFNTAAQKVFIKKYGNTNAYKALTDSVAAVEQKKLEEKVASMKVNEPAPDFELTDLEGRTVSLKSLRGKTVILDFWATWCQPCVASFPGMQKAVDYYKNDTSVVFMFVHTAEKSADPIGDVKRFMAYKKYRFDVFMDLKGKTKVAASFNVRNIPAKFIIDKNGIIQYKNTGYISEEEAIPEISTMVNMMK